MNQDRYNAIVIGSGFGCAAAASSMAKAGLNTLLLEKGDCGIRELEIAFEANDRL